MDLVNAVLLSGILAFVINMPLGVWRVQVRKRSFRWFLAIHLGVPGTSPKMLETG